METTSSSSTGLPIVGRPSLFLKSLIIAGMALALWLPTNIILSLVKERAARQQEAVTDIGSKWAGKQVVGTPVICIPYTENNNGYTTHKQ
jgi:inner membrane protein